LGFTRRLGPGHLGEGSVAAVLGRQRAGPPERDVLPTCRAGAGAGRSAFGLWTAACGEQEQEGRRVEAARR
jgi:hypothetical protein